MPWVKPEMTPSWGKRIPGLLDWELDRLAERSSKISISDERLKDGLLVVEFDWPFQGKAIQLEATFPSSYPFLRPHVRLLTDPVTWPDRHVNPIDGTICLLGRDSAQWTPDLYLVWLLDHQLENALLGQGPEDPQGEPAEFWWNVVNPPPDSYLLVDSSWTFGNTEQGKLDVKYVVDERKPPNAHRLRGFRGVVMRVTASDGAELAKWTGTLPKELRESRRHITIPWHRSESTLLPSRRSIIELNELRDEYFDGPGRPHNIARDYSFRAFAIIQPMEIAYNEEGMGWIVGGEWGSPKQFSKRPTQQSPLLAFLPIMRGGEKDIGIRVPGVSALKGKRIAIIGVGAIGAPVAVELARNGVHSLQLLDYDRVEPGNSIRWPLGVEAWGKPKVLALKDFLEEQYPRVVIKPLVHQLGNLYPDVSDEEIINCLLADTDLVVDAAVSDGITQFLWDRCDAAGIPIIKLGATPTLGGGTVARFAPGSGCPECLQWARHKGKILTPPGSGDASLLKQPPGCSERTFEGADFDLQELSLQAVRLIVETVFSPAPPTSLVQTLSMKDASNNPILPTWDQRSLDKRPECCGTNE